MTRSFVRALACVALLALSALVVLAPRSTQAQEPSATPRRVLVLAPAGEARLARSIGTQARDRAIATLGARGFTAARGPAGCAEPDCATELLRGGRGGARARDRPLGTHALRSRGGDARRRTGHRAQR